MKMRTMLGWAAAAMIAVPGTITLASGPMKRDGTRRDPLVGPHPNAMRESERPLMGDDRVNRGVLKESPRNRANATVPVAGFTSERLDRRVRPGSPRGEVTWRGR